MSVLLKFCSIINNLKLFDKILVKQFYVHHFSNLCIAKFKTKIMKIAVVGATGMVGTVMLKVLEERNFPFTELLLVASERSVGKKMVFKGKEYHVIGLQDAVNQRPNHCVCFTATRWISGPQNSYEITVEFNPERACHFSSQALYSCP